MKENSNLVVKNSKKMGHKDRPWYLNRDCYNTDIVRWILAQDKGADVFVFYQRLFALSVQLGEERLSFAEINSCFLETNLFTAEFIDYALFNLVKIGLVKETGENENGNTVIWVQLPDNEILRRKL